MKFYDMHVHAKDLDKTVGMAQRLGLSGLVIVEYEENFEAFRELKKKLPELSEKSGLDLAAGVEIRADSIKSLKRWLAKYRDIAEIIIVAGGDYAINRAAAEDPRVDILAHPEYKRTDSGIDHIVAKSAAQNGVMLELNVGELIGTYKRIRAHILSHMERNLELAGKFGTQVVITSGANDEWGLRGARELAAISMVLGMKLEDAVRSVSDICEARVVENRKKLSGKILFKGVEVE